MPTFVSDYAQLMRFDRPVGTLLLLWPTLAALWLAANGTPSIDLIIIFTIGTVVMRAAGCVINDYADRNIDLHVERTRDRPLAAHRVSETEALLLLAVLLAIAALLIVFLNPLTRWMALGGVAVAAFYPLMKRLTYLPQVVLGIAFSWGILLAFTSIEGRLPEQAWLLFIASLVWIVAYDTLYAMVDRDDDLKIGVKSTAILFGSADRLMIGVLQLATLVTLILLGLNLGYGTPFYLAVLVTGALFGYQQQLIRDRDRAGCFKAFRNNVWVGFAWFIGIVVELEVVPRLNDLPG
ncbi:MAG: 4-hydroxybenzoate octaprenyltransferase [Gammaproteobacteria bacterium]|nr:MAG: 4-hydroxybenzoate octaprenyltransferase [Gammaproteobacteria bacterium]TDJ42788.1 MAG: 4-hydroxybenzoate octaprenyltransferase [Gammaproteobacteria bacterium]